MAGGLKEEMEVSVFRNGRSQAVRIPKAYEFTTDKVLVSRSPDGGLHIRPVVKKKTMAEVLQWLRDEGPIDDFPDDIEDFPAREVDLDPPE